MGEYLRVTVEGWAKAQAPTEGNAPSVSLGHDPMNRATGWDATVPSLFSAQIPMRLDL